MPRQLRRLIPMIGLLVCADAASAQTADEVIDKTLAAMGGRSAHERITSRAAVSTITMTTPAGDINGTMEILNAPPNKVRTVMRLDLSKLGAGQVVIEQRFDGQTGYAMDSMRGNRDITGAQLDNMRDSVFPHAFLDLKARGVTVKLGGREKVGDREMLVLIAASASGSPSRHYIDAETFLPARMVMMVNVPQLGKDVEATTELLDYREVDGIKVPFRLRTTTAIQTITITLTSVTHNVAVDEALFKKPAGQ